MRLFALCGLALCLPLAFVSAASAAPTPVLLGNAGVFAVLAGSGITNTGVTTISGDTGSSPLPSETGFSGCPAADCIAQTGTNHNQPNPNDTATQNAKTDLGTAYGVAAGQTPTQIPTELAGQTLTPGVYRSAAGTFGMSGTLVLDGNNNADAVFIFQMGSTLITGSSGNVTFLRGAQACNVFWQVGSSATLGSGSNFAGTILANTSISVNDGVTVQGRLLAGEAGAGAVTLIHDTILTPTTCVTQAENDQAAANAAALVQAQAAAAAKAIADTAAAAAAKLAADTAAATAAAQAAATAQAAAAAQAAATKAAAKAAAAKAARAATAARARRAATTRARHKLTTIHTARTHAGFTG